MKTRTRRAWMFAFAGLMGGVLLGTTNCAHPTRAARPLDENRPHVRVMTFNVNFGIAGDVPTLAAITEGNADLVFLQETTPDWEQSLRGEFAHAYPHMTFHHCCGAGGLAVMSRFPFEERALLDPPARGWFPSLIVVAQTPLGKLQALNVHLRPPASDSGSFVSGYFSTPPVRLEEMKTYYPELDPTLATLVVGDFNEDRDGRAARYLREKGFTSALPEFSPKQHTWRWPTPVMELRGQLDHVFYDARLEPADVRVLELGRSDHLPIIADFEGA